MSCPEGDFKEHDIMLLSQAVEGFILDCEARNLSPSTLERVYHPTLRDLTRSLDDPHLENITTKDLRQFIVELKNSNRFGRGNHPWMEEIKDSSISPFTVHRYVRTIKTFLKWCVNEELLPSSPADKLGYPELPKHGRVEYFTPDEVQKVLDAAKKLSYRNYTITFLMLDTGIRRKELVDLDLDDVNVGSGQVSVREGKGRKPRKVRCGNACRKVLWRYVNDQRRPLHNNVQAFFIGRDGGRIGYEAIGSIFRRLSKETGLRVYAHKLRHTFATMFAKRTPNAILLADALGHEDLNMAKWYVHLTGTDSTDDRSPMDYLMSGDF